MHPVVYEIKNALREVYPESEAFAIAKMLLIEVFGFSTLEIYGGKDKEFSGKHQLVLDEMLSRLRKNEPIQYIVGKENFCGLAFEVNPHVLIPRPETRELVEWILADRRAEPRCRILDVGTGSGCIPVTLAKNLNGSRVESWDISAEALEVAHRNCEKNGVDVCLRQKDVLTASPEGVLYDVIVSNPPYIAESEKNRMEANVLDWEPSVALFVDDSDPLLFYRKIAELALLILDSQGALYFEINRAYGMEIVSMLEALGYTQVELRKDGWGNDRMVKAVKAKI